MQKEMFFHEEVTRWHHVAPANSDINIHFEWGKR